MNKVSKLVRPYINPDIKVGDQVRLTDGSGLSIVSDDFEDEAPNYYIPFEYPSVTGSDKPLKEIPCTVLETGVKDWCCEGAFNRMYLQDIVVQVGNAKFRTCSQFVSNFETSNIKDYGMVQNFKFTSKD